MAILALATALTPVSFVHAATRTWTGLGDGQSWVLNTNWSANAVPVSIDTAVINTINGPSITTTVPNITSLVLGSALGTAGLVNITGTNASLTTSSVVYIGQTGTGTLNLTNGGRISSNNAFYIGMNAGSSGEVNVTGVGSALNMTGNNLNVGRYGSGVLNITDQASMNISGSAYVGNYTDSDGVLNISGNGTSVTIGASLQIASRGEGALYVSNGALLTNINGGTYFGALGGGIGSGVIRDQGTVANLRELQVGPSGEGYLTIIHGATVTNIDIVYIGVYNTSKGIVDVIGNGSSLSSNGGFWIGYQAEGTLNIDNNASVTSVGDFIVGVAAGSTGIVRVANGAQLHTQSDTHIGQTLTGNGSITLSNNATWKSDGTIFIAGDNDTQGSLIIGAAANQAAATAGILDAGKIVFGNGNGSVIFNHTSDSYVFATDLEGDGTLNFVSGTTYMTGDGSLYNGQVIIGEHARLHMGGTLSAVNTVVENQAVLSGTGTLGNVQILNGGRIAPGNSIGELNVTNATFESGSLYQVEVDGAGNSDHINASGSVVLNGGQVQVIPYPEFNLSRTYTIITAGGNVSGAFDGAFTSAPFLQPVLSYDAQHVYLRMTPSITDTARQQVADTYNREHTLDALFTGNPDNPALSLLVGSPDNATAQNYLDAFSGEIHPGIANALISQQAMLRKAPFDSAGRVEVRNPWADETFWLRVSGMKRKADDSNVSSLSTDAVNTMIGYDKELPHSFLSHAGIAFGHTASWYRADEQRGKADAESYHVLLYGDKVYNQTTLRGGMSYSWHRIDSERNTQIGAFQDRNEAKYNASSVQLFVEADHNIALTQETAMEPYAQLAYIRHDSGSFSESGVTGLHGQSDDRQIGAATTGLRLKHDLGHAQEAGKWQVMGGLGYRYQVGDVNSASTHAFNTDPVNGFAIKGAPLERHTGLVEAGIAYRHNEAVSMHLGYEGAFSGGNNQHTAIGQIKWKF